ncbi:MAG: hypothetical protein HEEMFOPI_01711 [Holosporales bacterium]
MEEKLSTWTVNDIKTLSTCYTKGMTIKEISQLLNRTPTALHKAISRFGLKSLHPKNNQDAAETWYGIPSKEETESVSYLKKFFENCFNETWVDFQTVLEYLKKQRVMVEPLGQFNKKGEELYSIGQKIFLASQILLIANRLRVEENASPFKVKNLSF